MNVCFSKENIKLINQHLHILNWSIYLAMRVTGKTAMITKQDLFQEGYIAMARAAATYDGSTAFETYAQVVVRNAISDYVKKFRTRSCVVSLDADLAEDFSLYDVLGDDEVNGRLEETQAYLMLENLACRYTGVTRKGVWAIQLKLQGKTYGQIASKFDTEENNVRAWVSRARQRMRREGLHHSRFDTSIPDERSLVC